MSEKYKHCGDWQKIHLYNITQKYLGMAVGFPERNADIHLTQYETGFRKPKTDLTAVLVQVCNLSPMRWSCRIFLCGADVYTVGQL